MMAIIRRRNCFALAVLYTRIACKASTFTCSAASATTTSSQSTEHTDMEKPVVAIIGGGLAGLSAAYEASQAGASVFVLEKQPQLGGNSAKATSGINAAKTEAQLAKGVTEDSFDKFAHDVIDSGGNRSSPELVELITGKSREAVDWLQSNFGLHLSVLSHGGGHQYPRTHRLGPGPDGRPQPIGWTTVKSISDKVKALEGVNVLTGARVTELLQGENGKIVGVKYIQQQQGGAGSDSGPSIQPEEATLKAGAVILATGGFAYDRSETSLLVKYAPEKQHLPTTNGPQAQGDGIRLAIAAGAALVDMKEVQVHPTSLVDPNDPLKLDKFLAPEALRGDGGILINGDGRRFVNELTLRSKVTQAIFDHGKEVGAIKEGVEAMKVAYLLLNDRAAKAFGLGTLNFYKSKGLVQTAEGVAEVCSKLKLNEGACDILKLTLEEYNKAAETGKGDPFGKTIFPVGEFNSNGTFYMAIVTPAIHYTMGGVRINTSAQVLRQVSDDVNTSGDSDSDSELAPTPGLYAVGEVTGGVHGVNRLVGNSLLECVVMGRIAGQEAAHYALGTDGKDCAAAAPPPPRPTEL